MGTRTAILLMDPAEGAYVNALGKSAIMPPNYVSPLLSVCLFTIGVGHTHLAVHEGRCTRMFGVCVSRCMSRCVYTNVRVNAST